MCFRVLIVALLAAAVALAPVGCAGSNGPAAGDDTTAGTGQNGPPSAGSSEHADHNQADIAFAQAMVRHHEQAISMAQLAGTRSESSRVGRLAKRIKTDRETEVEILTDWLEQRGAALPGSNGAAPAEQGAEMLPPGQVVELAHTSGPQFDRMFLRLMIEHHEGAVRLAHQVIGQGTNGAVEALARDIIRTQEAEIWEMEFLLR